MTPIPSDPHSLAALLLAVDPQGLGGAVVSGPGGPAPEGWCHFFRGSLPDGTPWRRVPLGVTADRLAGGVELAETLRTGRRVLRPGIPAEAHGGILILPSAERLRPEVGAILLEALDRGRVRVEREGLSADLPARVAVVALDEATEAEPVTPDALRDRVAFLLALPPRWTAPGPGEPGLVEEARARLPRVEVPDGAVGALAALGQGSPAGPLSLRVSVLALRAARALAALRGGLQVEALDVWLAGVLVLAPRGVPMPPPPEGAPSGMDAPPPEEVEAPPPEAAPEAGPQADAPPQEADARKADPREASGAPPEEAPAEEAMEAGGEGADHASGPPSGTPDPDRPQPLPDRLVAAVAALLPELEEAGARRRAGAVPLRGMGGGRGGVPIRAHERGRRVGAERGPPGRGRRLDLSATLRAAAPWQRAREAQAALGGGRRAGAQGQGGGGGGGEVRGEGVEAGVAPPSTVPTLRVTAADLHVQRRVRAAARRTIFVVDASGSQALRRLGEVKGAVELLLADSYRVREEVALVAFRDRDARLLLPPTRSLTRARRVLRGLPGGGGTPLARGLAQAMIQVEQARREGVSPRVLLLTDGRPNVDAAGRGGRPRAREDALSLARALREAGGAPEVVILDTGLRPEPFLEELAAAAGARLRHLPFADARRIRQALESPARDREVRHG